MNLPNKITAFRILISPLFFILFFLPQWTGFPPVPAVGLMWFLFIIGEISDILDGYFARKLGLVGDIGKLLDPFADVISRLTYFLCFIVIGLMPIWAFLIIMYREFGILFLRLLMLKKGIALGARIGGKIKAVIYAIAGVAGLLHVTRDWLEIPLFEAELEIIVFVIFIIAALAAVISFADYFILFRKEMRKHETS